MPPQPSPSAAPLVAIIMGSQSDWETMANASTALTELGIPHECRVLSAHRTPDQLFAYIDDAGRRGVEVYIAGAGGAAHLAGVIAAKTVKPVLGVPIQSKSLQGLDSLLSMVQMPAGVPVGTLAIGNAGATNAGLLAGEILALARPDVRKAVESHRRKQSEKVLACGDPREAAAGTR